eukprot:32725-Chlamydomonas_euryale.AAC.6
MVACFVREALLRRTRRGPSGPGSPLVAPHYNLDEHVGQAGVQPLLRGCLSSCACSESQA